jgi:outer membrane protein OmpA-like peptidoglycan-associated protein
MAPLELNTAQQALNRAEKSFSDDASSYRTRDLSYVAQRKSQMADAQASIATEQKSTTQSNTNFTAAQGSILEAKSEDLDQTRTALALSERTGQATATQLSTEQRARLDADKRTMDQKLLTQEKAQDLNQAKTALAVSERNGVATSAQLAASERSGAATATQLAAEQKGRVDAEKRAADAQAALLKLAAIKEDTRGMVITLSGSVLFRSDEAILMPGAESKLNQVVDALSSTTDRNVMVEGFTDSQGSDRYNLDLSQRRADAVRDYLVHAGYPASRIQSRGIGKERPIADNMSAEGRANNRRVEVILERAPRQ